MNFDRFKEGAEPRDLEREAEIAADKADHKRDSNPQPQKVKAVRLQLSRRKGFNLQKQSLMVNGLPAVNCARPGRWGNPYKIGDAGIETNADAKLAFFNYTWRTGEGVKLANKAMHELRGKNLACFCKLSDACHCDVLLEMANK